MRDGDVGDLLYTSITSFLLHLEACYAGLIVGRTLPFAVGKAEGHLGEFVDISLKIGAWNGFEHVVVVEPQVPRPDHSTALGDSDDGVAVLDVCGGHFEVHKSVSAAARYGEVGYNAALVGPDNLRTVGRIGTAVALRNPRVGDVLVVMVLEVGQDISAAVACFIRVGVGCAVRDSRAIDQGYLVPARSGNQV